MSSRCGIQGRTDLILSKINYSTNMASVASRQAIARNIADSAVTWLQPRSNTCNDATVVRDHVTFHVTFGFQPINGGAYIMPTDNYGIPNFLLIFDDNYKSTIVHQKVTNNVTYNGKYRTN